MWHVYILQCSDSSYYVGMTEDLKTRVCDHNKGRGARYTKLKRPVKLVYSEEAQGKRAAEAREQELKKLSLKNKEKLIKFGRGQRVSLVAE